MFTFEELGIMRDAINHYGPQKQMIKAVEELSELQKELCKYLLDNAHGDMLIAEEIADVEIMTEQLKSVFQIHDHVEKIKHEKLLKLKERIK